MAIKTHMWTSQKHLAGHSWEQGAGLDKNPTHSNGLAHQRSSSLLRMDHIIFIVPPLHIPFQQLVLPETHVKVGLGGGRLGSNEGW